MIYSRPCDTCIHKATIQEANRVKCLHPVIAREDGGLAFSIGAFENPMIIAAAANLIGIQLGTRGLKRQGAALCWPFAFDPGYVLRCDSHEEGE
jgi:hypothetical protein